MTASLWGDGRQSITTRIVAAYDEVAAGGPPLWVSIEAPSGWGKTRIIQEVYARLAADRQGDTGRYWPTGLTGGVAERSDILRDRKNVAPAYVEREPGSVPAYFWWGISAFERSGIPSVALAQDLRQFDGHLPYLVARCKQLSRLRERGSASAREIAAIALEEAGDELTSAVLDLAGLGIPGVGFVWRLGTWTAGRIAEARRERRLIADGSTIRDDRSQIAVDAYDTIRSVSRTGLPLVVVVEDLQYADATLIDLLARLLGSGKPILVLTTSWPGSFDEAEQAVRQHGSDARIVRLSTTNPSPVGWPALEPLADEDLAAIVREYYPHATTATIDALTRRSDNPLQLRLLCTLPSIARQASEGFLDVDPAVIEALPASLDGMFEQMWMQLPDAVRESLAFALCGIPTDIDPSPGGGDDRWDAGLLASVARSLFPDARGLVDAIDSAQTGYAWAELVEEALRTFPDEANRRIVEARRPEFYSSLDIDRIRRELTRVIGDELDDPALAESVRQHRAALLLALSAEGFGVDAGALDVAAEVQTELLEALDESDRVIDVIDRVSRTLPEPEPEPEREPEPELEPEPPVAARPVLSVRIAPMKPELRLRRGIALTRSGRWEEAQTELDEVRAHAELLGGADDPLAIDARIARASLELRRPDRNAEPDLGLTDLERAVQRVFGTADERILALLRLRRELSIATEVAGLPDVATATGRFWLADLAEKFGLAHPEVIALHRLAAKEARDNGYPAAGAGFLAEFASSLETIVGSAHPELLRLRLEVARCLVDEDRIDDAVALAAPIHALLRDTAGPHEPDTVDALVVLASAAAAEPGALADLDDEIRSVVADYPEAIDQGPLMRLRVAYELMRLAADDDADDETLGRLLDLVALADETLGVRDEEVTDLRIATAEALLEAGYAEAAFTIAEGAAWLSAPWAVQPRTWRAVMVLGRCHELLDRPVEASTAYAFVLSYADDVAQVAHRGEQPADRARAVAERAEAALDRVQRVGGSGWYPTEYVDVRPRDRLRPSERALPQGDDEFVASDDEILRLAQHRDGRAIVYGGAETTAWELSRALLQFRLNRGEYEPALAIARELLSFEVVPLYAQTRWRSAFDWTERTIILWDAVRSARELDRREEALELIDDTIALAETPEQLAEMLDDKATLLMEMGRPDDALAALEQLATVLDAGPARAAVRERALAIVEDDGDVDDILRLMDEIAADATDPSEIEQLVERKLFLLEEHDRPDDIVITLRDALATAPTGSWRTLLLTRLANALDDVGQQSAALGLLDEALGEQVARESRASLLRARAWLHTEYGADALAVEDLREVLEIEPDDGYTEIALVGPLLRLGQIDEATARFTAAVDASRAAGLAVSDFDFRLRVLRMVSAHGDAESAVVLAEEYLLLLDEAALGSLERSLRSLGEQELASARARLG